MASRKEAEATHAIRNLDREVELVRSGEEAEGVASGAGAGAGASGAAAGGRAGGGSRRLEAQLERLSADLRATKAAAAMAMAERAALGAELLEQQKLQRKAKVKQLTDREKLTSMEVKLRTRKSDESEEQARIREVLAAQSEQILQLVGEKEALEAKLSAAEAKLA